MQNFVKQAAILGAASLIVRLMGFVYRVPLTNLIGDEGNAFYSSAYQIYIFALNLTSIYMTPTLARLVAERVAKDEHSNAHRLFRTAMAIALVLGAAGAMFMFFGAELLANIFNFSHGAVPAVRAVAPAVFIVSMLTVLRGYFQGMKTTSPTAASQVVEQIVNVGTSLLLAYLLFDAANVAYSAAGAAGGTAIAAGAALAVVAAIYFKRMRGIRSRVAADTNTPRERKRDMGLAIFRTAWPMVLGVTLFTLGSIVDIGMANALIPGTAAEVDVLVGQYTGKFVILTTLPVSLSMALAFAIIPEISSAQVQGDTGGLRDKTNTALRLSMFISMPAAVGLAVLAHPILGMLFPSHPDGGELLIIGSGVIIFLAVTHVAQGVLQGAGHVKLPVIGLLAGIAVKIGLNMLLMPRIGISGAVISSMACFAVTACANLFFLRKKCNWRPQIRTTFIKPALCAAVMGLACYATWWAVGQLTHSTIATLAALAVGFVTYIAMLMLVKSLTRQDIVGVMRNRGSRE